MTEATKVSSTTIKFGAGYDAPWFVAVGTVAAQRKQLEEVFGLQESNANTLAELIVEAGDYATALGTAATLGNKRRVDKERTAAVMKTRGDVTVSGPLGEVKKVSIADKAQPEDATDNVEELVANATSLDGLKDIYTKFKDTLTQDQLDDIKARKAVLISE